MSFSEKSIQCADCGTTFTFTVGEQEFFASKGFTQEPKRCSGCRKARRQQSGDSQSSSDRYSGSRLSARR